MEHPPSHGPWGPIPAADDPSGIAQFDLVPVRPRHDGWTPERQHDFIAALAESGCVTEACAAVRITTKSAYALRARADASTFRQAWDVALDFAIRRLGDAALSRALHGVSRPIFYKGEQIGERRHFDEKLTMFLLRYRDPVRYGVWLDGYEARRHPDGAGIVLAHALNATLDAAHDALGEEDAERPLAEGPPPYLPPPTPGDGGPENEGPVTVREIKAAPCGGTPPPPPEELDGRSALPILRPRRVSNRDVP